MADVCLFGNKMSNPSPEQVAIIQKYFDRGFRLLFYPPKQKGPTGADAVGWPERSDTIEEYWRWVERGVVPNVGTFTGHEIEKGKFLVDIDFDWPDGMQLAARILPETKFGFGRDSRPISHAFYTSPVPLPSMVFEGADGKPIVELRGTKQDGSAGLQTMLPPSIHPTGELLQLRMDDGIGHSDELPRRVALYATACILLQHFGHRGFLHDVRLATAGFLLSEGLPESEVALVGTAIADVSGNDPSDFKLVVKTTAQKLKKGERVSGKGVLIKALGEEHGKQILARIRDWLGCSEFFEDAKGKIVANHQDNIRVGLERLGVKLAFDAFSQKPMVEYGAHTFHDAERYIRPADEGVGMGRMRPLTDTIVNRAWLEIDERFNFRPDRTFFSAVVDNLCDKNKFHPILNYLRGLKWDGTARLEEWLITAGHAADTEYVRAVSKIMLLAAVRRITRPGCKYDEMVILESAQQGLLKSSALRALCPDERWFSDDLPLNVDSKQVVERTLGKWIIEASDLGGMKSSEVEHLKAMLSRQVDGPVRMAYGRIPIEQPRQFIIVGTTNNYAYLNDSTGNRRFWPIRINGAFDVEWILSNRDQLWAEAFVLEQGGASIRLSPDLYGIAALQQERRRVEDPWEMSLAIAFDEQTKWRVTADEFWNTLGIPINNRDPRNFARLLRTIERMGFRRMAIRVDGKVVKGFGRDPVVGQLDLNEENM